MDNCDGGNPLPGIGLMKLLQLGPGRLDLSSPEMRCARNAAVGRFHRSYEFGRRLHQRRRLVEVLEGAGCSHRGKGPVVRLKWP